MGVEIALPPTNAQAGSPYVNGEFQGRIAYSADGNNRDRDDLFASAVTIAMFKAFNVTDRVVHFDYNSILGVNWVQILNQQGLGTCPEPKHGPCPQEKWALWDWMRDSRSANVAWLYERLEAMGRPDCSDSGMVYFLLSGNEQPGVEDLNQLLHGKVPAPLSARRTIRLEAENFQLDDYMVPNRRSGSGVSQRMAAQLVAGKRKGSVRAVFNQLYAPGGKYDVEVRYFDGKEGHCELTLFVRGVQQGEPWTASSHSGTWQSRTIGNVSIHAGDEIMLKVQTDGQQTGGLDYVQFSRRD
jgi:hypothetical protein